MIFKYHKNYLYREITPEYKIIFENKINQLRTLNGMTILYLDNNIEVDRNNLFNDAFYSIMNKSPQELKGRFRIIYKGENGLDAGGLLRYFFIYLFI